MDERHLTLIEKTEEVQTEQEAQKIVQPMRQTNPIAKKLTEFHHKKISKFSVKDLFK